MNLTTDKMSSLHLESFDFDKDFEAYHGFAKENFGEGAYQTNKKYLEWLKCNDNESIIAVTNDGHVVGCIHGITLNWSFSDRIEKVTALHNLMVHPDYRKGIGAQLFLKTIERNKNILIPGVADELSLAYQRIGFHKISTHTYRKILRPLCVMRRVFVAKYFGSTAKPVYFNNNVILEELKNKVKQVNFDFYPADKIIALLANVCENENKRGLISPVWNEQQLKWRFFHPLGPRHLLLYLDDNGGNPTDFIILSLGPRKGLNVSRIMLVIAQSAQRLQKLLMSAESAIKKFGGDVMLNFHADDSLSLLYAELGWKTINSKVDTYFYSKDKIDFKHLRFSAAAGDYGLEAITTD